VKKKAYAVISTSAEKVYTSASVFDFFKADKAAVGRDGCGRQVDRPFCKFVKLTRSEDSI